MAQKARVNWTLSGHPKKLIESAGGPYGQGRYVSEVIVQRDGDWQSALGALRDAKWKDPTIRDAAVALQGAPWTITLREARARTALAMIMEPELRALLCISRELAAENRRLIKLLRAA